MNAGRAGPGATILGAVGDADTMAAPPRPRPDASADSARAATVAPDAQRPSAVATTPYIGRMIGERYRILEPLGAGGMGLVFKGEHTLMKKAVAIKLLHQGLDAMDDASKRFEREAQSASRLSHPSIVAVTDFGRADSGELFLVMEYVPGLPLSTVLERRPRLPVPEAIAVTRLILRGLAHAHAQGVVHRDLKPANVMVAPKAGTHDEAGRIESVKILDFGIAKMMGKATDSAPEDRANDRSGGDVLVSGGEGSMALTRSGMIFGTPSYMSPEQATGDHVDHRSDLYSCGVILYELLAGRKPFVADELVKIMAQQVTAPPPPFGLVAPEARVPGPVEVVVARALEKDRENRFQTAQQFLEALDNAERAMRRPSAAPEDVHAVLRAARRQLRHHVRATLADPARRRILAGSFGVAIALALLPLVCSEEKIEPAPVTPALREPLKQAEDAIAAGRLVEARAMLLSQLSKHPRSPRVQLHLGTLAFLKGDMNQGLAHYDEAVQLDPGLRADPALLLNVKSLLDDKDRARPALDFLATKVGKPAGDLLASIASTDRRASFRMTARQACEKHGCDDAVDHVSSLELDFKQAKTCEEKRAAIVGLADTGDKRAVPILEKARKNRGGALGSLLGLGNTCVLKDIDHALERLGS
jgi:serine/threonine-protein kinase